MMGSLCIFVRFVVWKSFGSLFGCGKVNVCVTTSTTVSGIVSPEALRCWLEDISFSSIARSAFAGLGTGSAGAEDGSAVAKQLRVGVVVGVRADEVEASLGHGVAADLEGDERRSIARDVVLGAGAEDPGVLLAQGGEPAGLQHARALRDGVERGRGSVYVGEQPAGDGQGVMGQRDHLRTRFRTGCPILCS